MKDLINYITNTLKNRNSEPLASNQFISFQTYDITLWLKFQEFLLLQHKTINKTSEELLINTDKAIITQLRLADALFTGKVIYDSKNKNHQKRVLFELFTKSIGIKSDIDLNITCLKKDNNLISNPKYILIEDNLLLLKKNLFIFENFLKEKKHWDLPDTLTQRDFILIEDMDSLLQKNIDTNSEEEITDIEHEAMKSFLTDYLDDIY